MTRADRFVCDICEYKATRQTLLTLHIESKHEGIRYGCNICPFRTITNNFLKGLKFHIKRKHNELVSVGKVVVFSCDLCSYKAFFEQSLKEHVQTQHEKLSLFSCTECEYKGSRKQSLKIHKEVRHANIRFSCSECEHKASTKQSLKIHTMAKHGEPLLSCNECEYMANTKGQLKTHIQVKHEKTDILLH